MTPHEAEALRYAREKADLWDKLVALMQNARTPYRELTIVMNNLSSTQFRATMRLMNFSDDTRHPVRAVITAQGDSLTEVVTSIRRVLKR